MTGCYNFYPVKNYNYIYPSLLSNMKSVDIDLTQIGVIEIPHNHMDHISGFQ
jgi:hypothetical protein